MQSRRDPNVLRSLALSFGEGLAFSVGMKLTQGAMRGKAPAEQPDFGPVVARLEEIEKRVQKAERPRDPQQLDQKVIHAIVSAIETRLQETSANVERRLTEIEGAIATTAQTIVARHVEQEAVALRAQVVEMHREFTGNVARIVAEQVALRSAEIESSVQTQVTAAIAPLQSELAELRHRMAETENTMSEFVSAISLMCRKASERNEEERAAAAEPAAPAPQAEQAGEPPVVASAPAVAASAPAELEMDLPVPAFAQVRKPPGIWRIPVASSFLFAFTAVGLLMRVTL
jgi:hypothetical protein